MQVTIQAASAEEQPVLDNLLQLYLHDFSEFEPVDIQADARYTYPYLEFYWQDLDRYPFLIHYKDKLAGFALVRVVPDPASEQSLTSLAEFFVLRRLRKLGIGREAAYKLWDRFPGNWIVEVLESNKTGHAFWMKVISDYTDNVFGKTDNSSESSKWTTFAFTGKSISAE
jgi:predicted acetyltransferase